MNDKIIILPLLIFFAGITLYLYRWQAKKQIEYNGDERWQLIQIKANNITKRVTDVIVVLLITVLEIVASFYGNKIDTTLTRIAIYLLFFFGLRNAIELFSSLYLDKHL